MRRAGKILKAAPRFNYALRKAFAGVLSDESLSEMYYLLHHKSRLNLKSPSTFNEKIMWMKLKWRDGRLPSLADKWAVREFVREHAGDDVLIPVHALVNSVEELDVGSLPSRFVIKPTHGSGWVSICAERAHYDWDAERRRLATWLSQDYYYHAREWIYRGLPRRLLVEDFLDGGAGVPPRDYKFFCFSGEPAMIQVDSGRFGEHRRDLYDVEWNSIGVSYRYPRSVSPPRRPAELEAMIEVCRKLSQPFPFVRVDLYGVAGRVFFGELTFFPENGIGVFSDRALDLRLGRKLTLPRSSCSDDSPPSADGEKTSG